MAEDDEGGFPVYDVIVGKDQNQHKAKALDAMALRQWMVIKEGQSSIMNLDPEKVGEANISYVQSRVFMESWVELRSMLDGVLGLVKPEPRKQEDLPTTPMDMDNPETANEMAAEFEDESEEYLAPEEQGAPMQRQPLPLPQQRQQAPKRQPPQNQPASTFYEKQKRAKEQDDNEMITL